MWDWFIGVLVQILGGIQSFLGDWGLAVIVLTVIVRVLLTPLMIYSAKSTARMQLMQPKIEEIKTKYEQDPARQGEEMRKLYADIKFNPLTGCLLLLLQMPIFFALFSVARQVPENASFYNIIPSITRSCADMVATGDWFAAAPYLILIILLGGLTLVSMLMTSTSQSKSQKDQMMIMGVMMTGMMVWFCWSVPAAAVLYYITSNAWQTAQQFLVTNRVIQKEKEKEALEAADKPIEVDVVRREKKARPKKKN